MRAISFGPWYHAFIRQDLRLASPKPLVVILRIPRATPRSPPPNQKAAFLHEATPLVGSVQSAYESDSEQLDGGQEALVVEETYPAN